MDAIVRALEHRAGHQVPEGGLRATAVAATGAGKTLIAAEAARRLEPRGRVLVMVPTLDLLTQTVQAWREAGHSGPAVAVCSLAGDEVLAALGVRCTTNPIRLALWAGSGPVTVFATYASLAPRQEVDPADPDGDLVEVPGPLEAALRGAYGQKLQPFGLAVVDEAHRTTGDAAKPWAAIHDQTRIPAARRLYLTATPRIWQPTTRHPGRPGEEGEAGTAGGRSGAQEAADGRSEAVPADAGQSGQVVASMDDTRLYGPQVFTFSLTEAIDRGILARFEIDVLEIHPPDPGTEGVTGTDGTGDVTGTARQGGNEKEKRSRRPAALPEEKQRGRRLAALQAALVQHAAATGVRSLITFHHRTVEAMAFARALPGTAARLHQKDPARYPRRVWADWLCGEHEPQHRRRVLDRFADGIDDHGWETELSVLANVRVLGEGVDITGRRGVDGVVFADVRGSAVDIVQAVGRALRQKPGQGKVARLVVPVFLEPGEAPDDMLASASYKPLIAVLQGLRSHSEQLVEQLAAASAPSRTQPVSVLGLDPAHDHDGGGGGEGSPPVAVPLLRFATPRDPQLIAQFIRTRVIQPESQIWLTGLTALRKWHHQHHNEHQDDHENQAHEQDQGQGDKHVGGIEGQGQEHDSDKHKHGDKNQDQEHDDNKNQNQEHDDNKNQNQEHDDDKNQDQGRGGLRERHQHNNHQTEPQGHNHDNSNREHRHHRKDGKVRTSGTTSPARGPVAVPLDARVGPFPLGQWVSEQRRAYRAGTLPAWRIELLEEAGMVWSVPDAAFEENLAAARTYHALHGTLCAPRTAVAEGRPVGQWLTNCRRPGGLGKNPQRAAERAARLAAIDPDWNPAEKGWTVDWQRHYTKLRTCLEGGATPDQIRPGITIGGEDIGLWLARQRAKWPQLTDRQRERLTTLGIQPTTPAGDGTAGNDSQTGQTPWAVTIPATTTPWDRALAALRQYQAREGHTRVPRKWIETVHDEAGHQHPIRLGVWISNQKSRRAKLPAERVKALEELGA
ncbi:Helicase associated domain protein [Streptomyces glaucosporus]|uniref:helicase associated domain-containing protein n=1 Tax=Streptomyces glaucosporus TaxID=284044 RepID=UPI003CD0893B